MEAACRFHTAPIGNKINEGSMKLPPSSTPSDMLKMEQRVGIPPLYYRGHGRTFPPSPPRMVRGIIELKQDGAWFLCHLVGFWNEKQGRRRLAQPSPSPAISPASLFPPSPASSLPSSSLLLAHTCRFQCLHPLRRGEAAIVACWQQQDGAGRCCR